jgi:hypothetical protein
MPPTVRYPTNPDQLSDRELQSFERPLAVNLSDRMHYIPKFPLSVLKAVMESRAEKALPLILSIHRQLTMSRREWTPLTAAVWNAAGSPSAREREAILQRLKSSPNLLQIRPRRTAISHYDVARGSVWILEHKC